MSKTNVRKSWFIPDDSYEVDKTEWFYLRPVRSGWYDVRGIEIKSPIDAFLNTDGTATRMEPLPYVERKWYDAHTGKWSISCMVGDPDDFEQTIKRYRDRMSNGNRNDIIVWRGLIKKPVYPPNYN